MARVAGNGGGTVAIGESDPTTVLRGVDADVDHVLGALPDAQFAHFATHGFFADQSFRSLMQLDQTYFQSQQRGLDRHAVTGRNPLVLSGLVLAGGNLAPSSTLADAKLGVLTAESIAGLPLGKLELAVLSACETGLGEVAGGEGVFGLQRAFHVAGTQDVIASLWKVDDRATQELMRRFYSNLWTRKMSKLEALRDAQLWMLRNARKLEAMGVKNPQTRGLRLQSTTASTSTRKPDPNRTAAYFWAAFQLSGSGL